MDDQEFVIRGTADGILKILEQDFSMPQDEARFLIYALISYAPNQDKIIVNKNELTEWYLESSSECYQGEILNTHLVINFTNVKKELYHKVYQFLVQYLLLKKISIIQIGADMLYIVISAIKKINDTDYCIFARIVELCLENKNTLFKKEDIFTCNKYGKCDYQSDKWKCTYLQNVDECTCNDEKINLAFLSLESQNVIKKVDNQWVLVQ